MAFKEEVVDDHEHDHHLDYGHGHTELGRNQYPPADHALETSASSGSAAEAENERDASIPAIGEGGSSGENQGASMLDGSSGQGNPGPSRNSEMTPTPAQNPSSPIQPNENEERLWRMIRSELRNPSSDVAIERLLGLFPSVNQRIAHPQAESQGSTITSSIPSFPIDSRSDS